MKKCTYCGRDHDDDAATSCALDGHPLRRVTDEEAKHDRQAELKAKEQPPADEQGGMTIRTWGKIGGVVGFIAVFALFRDKSSQLGEVLVFSSFIKGALGGGLGAAIFAGLGMLLGAKK